jgi:CRP-like cAMP-binding protein
LRVLEVLPQLPAPGYSLADGFGAVGLCLYIGSYLALQLGIVRGDGYLYAVLNLLAATFVLISLMEMFNLYAALSEVAWIAISLIGIARLYIVHRFLSLTPEERAAAHALVPGLAKDRARRLLRTGAWVDLPAGEVLATEGEPVGALVFIAEGRCRIVHRGVRVAEIGPGGMIGEMTYQTGAPATATVVAGTPVRVLRLEAQPLRAFLSKNEDVAEALERAVAGDLRRKLAETTRALAGDAPTAPG